MRKLICISIFVLTAGSMLAQKGYKTVNLGGFDRKNYHFGFLLGFNSADFYIDRKSNPADQDSLLTVNSQNQPGFNLGIVAAWHFNKNISVRFTPTLSFEDRSLNYVFYSGPDSTTAYAKRVESTFIDFPLDFKFRTDRLGNVAFYAIAGARFRLDMQSEKDVKNAVADEIIVKTQKNDFAIEFGGGTDFFLEYFKFGIELKLAVGMRNLLVPEATQFSNPINSLRSRTLLISFTFEG